MHDCVDGRTKNMIMKRCEDRNIFYLVWKDSQVKFQERTVPTKKVISEVFWRDTNKADLSCHPDRRIWKQQEMKTVYVRKLAG